MFSLAHNQLASGGEKRFITDEKALSGAKRGQCGKQPGQADGRYDCRISIWVCGGVRKGGCPAQNADIRIGQPQGKIVSGTDIFQDGQLGVELAGLPLHKGGICMSGQGGDPDIQLLCGLEHIAPESSRRTENRQRRHRCSFLGGGTGSEAG